MGTSLITLIAVLVAFMLLWLVFFKKDGSDKPNHFSCHLCGEKNCDCVKDIPEKK